MSIEDQLARALEPLLRKVVREELARRQADEAVSIPEAARRLGVSVSTVRRQIRAREIPSFRVGSQVRIRASAIAPADDAVIDLAARARAR